MDANSSTATMNESGLATDSSQQNGGPRVNNACEACRAAKVKCTASSSQLGICRRCYESKRECIFKTGPRTRRSRQSKVNPTATRPQPPPPGPSKTFTIDVSLPQDNQPLNFDGLRDWHEAFVDSLFPSDPPPLETRGPSSSSQQSASLLSKSPFESSSLSFSNATSGSVTVATLSSSWSTTTTTAAQPTKTSVPLRRPQFNLGSATSLLATFRNDMSLYFPVLHVPNGTTVSDLVRDQPFVLLALLAAASGTRTALRGSGSLYDEEFRKILALKFVASGERSVELLVGLLVYCAWYPVHLRPRNKQSAQYVRMAVDLVHDLELDQPEYLEQHQGQPREEILAAIRAYLACCYLVLVRSTTYGRPTTLPFTAWTAACCDMLEREAITLGDRVLPWLLRHQHLVAEVVALSKDEEKGPRSPYQAATMLRGLDMELAEYSASMPEDVANTSVMRLATLSTQINLLSPHLFKGKSIIQTSTSINPLLDASRMQLALPHLTAALSFISKTLVGNRQLVNLSNSDWGSLIMIIIVAFTLSFDVPSCPAWDAAFARSQVDLGALLDQVTDRTQMRMENPGSQRESDKPSEDDDMTIVGASRVVFSVVKAKFDKRMAAVQQQQQSIATRIWSLFGRGCSGGGMDSQTELVLDKTVRGCPMFDGSLDNYIPIWGESFTDQTGFYANVAPGDRTDGLVDAFDWKGLDQVSGRDGQQAQASQDLWATMTMEWAESEASGRNQTLDSSGSS